MFRNCWAFFNMQFLNRWYLRSLRLNETFNIYDTWYTYIQSLNYYQAGHAVSCPIFHENQYAGMSMSCLYAYVCGTWDVWNHCDCINNNYDLVQQSQTSNNWRKSQQRMLAFTTITHNKCQAKVHNFSKDLHEFKYLYQNKKTSWISPKWPKMVIHENLPLQVK